MIILVSDTSVLVDLDRGGLLVPAFSCGFTMIVLDLLYERELENNIGPYLRSLGMGVVSLTPAEMQLVQEIRRGRNGLSLPEIFALACSHRPNHVLISSAKALGIEAKKRLRDAHNILWILDAIAKSGAIDKRALVAGLETIQTHPTRRLPKDEVNSRINLWSK